MSEYMQNCLCLYHINLYIIYYLINNIYTCKYIIEFDIIGDISTQGLHL